MPEPYDLTDMHDAELRFVAVTSEQMNRALAQLESCEACNPDAEIPFDWVIESEVRLVDYVDYILPAVGRCPRCHAEIHEKTLVQPDGGVEMANCV